MHLDTNHNKGDRPLPYNFYKTQCAHLPLLHFPFLARGSRSKDRTTFLQEPRLELDLDNKDGRPGGKCRIELSHHLVDNLRNTLYDRIHQMQSFSSFLFSCFYSLPSFWLL